MLEEEVYHILNYFHQGIWAWALLGLITFLIILIAAITDKMERR